MDELTQRLQSPPQSLSPSNPKRILTRNGLGGGSENSEGIPKHKVTRILSTKTFESKMQFTKEETKYLPKTALASKVVNPFTHALAPPFIGRRRDFLHSENTLDFREYS
jgi:hypothetical protein